MSTEDFVNNLEIRETAGYAGLIVTEPIYCVNFFDNCITYYNTVNYQEEIRKIEEELTKFVKRFTNQGGEYNNDVINMNKFLGKDEADLVTKINILINRKRILTDFANKKLEPKKKIKEIFTSWVKYLLPVPRKGEKDDSMYKKVEHAIMDLLPDEYRMLISNINSNLQNTIYDTISLPGKYNAKNMSGITQIVYHMVFYLCTPDLILRNRILIYENETNVKKKIFEIREANVGKIEDRNNILAISDDMCLKDLESQLDKVYRIPMNVFSYSLDINSANDDYTNMMKGLEVIRRIIGKKFSEVNSDIAKNFKNKLANTDSGRSFYLFLETSNIFPEKDTKGGSFIEKYVFYDILCDQYFQEYKHGIDIEHVITHSNLCYLVDYCLSFEETDMKKVSKFNFFLSIFEFALCSHFIQVCVTDTCNRSAQDKQRSINTVYQYISILEFVCKLYYCKKYKLNNNKIKYRIADKDDYEEIGDDESYNDDDDQSLVGMIEAIKTKRIKKMIGNKIKGRILECKVSEYIDKMHENSKIFYEDDISSLKESFKEFPTLILPKKFINKNDTMIDPLRLNFEYVCNIGRYCIESGIDTDLEKIETPVYMENMVNKLNKYDKKVTESDFKNNFGIEVLKQTKVSQLSKPIQKVKKVSPSDYGLPNDIENRIRKLENLLYKVPYRKSLFDN